jgi:hypothetical protein
MNQPQGLARRRTYLHANIESATWRLHPHTGKIHLFVGNQPHRALCGTTSYLPCRLPRHAPTAYCRRCFCAAQLSPSRETDPKSPVAPSDHARPGRNTACEVCPPGTSYIRELSSKRSRSRPSMVPRRRSVLIINALPSLSSRYPASPPSSCFESCAAWAGTSTLCGSHTSGPGGIADSYFATNYPLAAHSGGVLSPVGR